MEVILPNNVSGLRETASYKETFDDVDFLIHSLREESNEIQGGETQNTKSTEKL